MGGILIKDRAGTDRRVQASGTGTNEDPFLILPCDREIALAAGGVYGRSPFDKFGKIADMDAADSEWDVWNGEGIYTGFPTGAAETMEILSDNAADTGDGTGARTVRISKLLDGDFNEMPDVEVTLNGTTPVSLGAATYSRASRIEVLTAGTGGQNAGTITLRHTSTTANIFAEMPVGKNQTTICCSTVPAGKTLYVKYLHIGMARASGAAGSEQVEFRVREIGEVFRSKVLPQITESKPFTSERAIYILPEKTDFKWHVSSVSDNGTSINGEIFGELVDNESVSL